MLFQAAMMFVGVVLVLVLQTLMTAADFPVGDVIAMTAAALVVLAPVILSIMGMQRVEE